MRDSNYSVIIRTIGKASEKYQRLLDSIDELKPKPYEVIVVLPEGYALPKQQLGWERFVFSKKGMVTQRLYGMEACVTPYALFCDDDVEFDSDFVKKLMAPIAEMGCAFTAGPLYDFLPPKGLNTFINTICGSAAPTVFHKTNYCTVLNTTGYSFNRHLKESKLYYAQSLPWTCFFADVEKMKMVELDKEMLWLDKHGYGAMDDLTMFYKAYLLGYNTCVIPNALYKHNDAKTSTRDNTGHVDYALSFNRLVFWHRFLYKRKRGIHAKMWSKICFGYNIFTRLVLCVFSDIRGKKDYSSFKIYRKGFKDATLYLKSDDYKSLPQFKVNATR